MSIKRQSNPVKVPRVFIAGMRGSGGKTLVSLGVIAALARRGRLVVPFKKGADYIDAAWLSTAAGHACRNLDLFMVEREQVYRSFVQAAPGGGISVIEGNRGLYDGMNVEGTYSSAELAKLIKAPVILVCDSTKTTRTLAAMIVGCKQFDREVNICGVVLNRVAGRRHEAILREVIDRYCALPVVGAIPKLRNLPFPERHLGLVPPQEHDGVPDAVRAAADAIEQYVDLDAIENIAAGAPELADSKVQDEVRGVPSRAAGANIEKEPAQGQAVRIAVLRDEAFQFYYPENLEALEREGARLLELSPLRDNELPRVDAIYIGGGFPETLAEPLAANRAFREAIASAVDEGMPVYAECAGAVYLGQKLIMGDRTYPMTGAMPVTFGFEAKPQGHGYAMMETVADNPYYSAGEILRGHEFHYSRVLDMDERELSFAFKVQRGYGVDGERDGMCRRNVLATYCHIHALGVPNWARTLVQAAKSYKKS
ncbi:MAG: cobyrinate a,c-diamide synthase [Candidatus Latescibacterota bacterium]